MLFLQLSIASAVLFFVNLVASSYYSGLAEFPGPFHARFSNLWRLIQTWRGHYEQTVQNLHRRHGNAVRIGPGIVSLTDPDVIESIYGSKADLPKSDFYKVMQTYHNGEIVPTLLTVTDKKIHARLRRPVANIFAMGTLTRYEPLIDRTICDLIRILRRDFADGSRPQRNCDVDHWLSYFAFDVMSGIAFSRSFGFLDHGHDMDDMMKNLARNFKYCAIVGQMPWLDNFLWKNPLFRFLSAKSDPFSVRAGQLFRDRISEEKKASIDSPRKDADGGDIVSRILEVKKIHPEQVPDETVVGYIMTILLAGSDTVSITLRSIVYYLSKHPHVQKRLQDEIDNAELDYPVSWTKAQDLPYLDAIIKEALRVHPPTSILLERVVSPAGLTLPDGRVLKPGTIVSMNGWTINQNPEVFGHDARVFNPDRWLQHAHETETAFQTRTRRMKRADIAFGYGPRSCLGKPIAYMEIVKLVPTLFGLFDIRLAHPGKEWQYRSYFVTEQHDMDVILTARKSGSSNAFQ